MKNKYLSILCLIFGAITYGQAQDESSPRICATHVRHLQLLATDSAYRHNFEMMNKQITQVSSARLNSMVNGIIVIPVVFHVIKLASGTYNVTDAFIQAQVNQLNADFRRMNSDRGNTGTGFKDRSADCEIQFCLATRDPSGAATTGITRTDDATTSWTQATTNDFDTRIKPATVWDATRYLNVWTANLTGGLLGYAQFAGGPANSDGVVVKFSSVGSIASPNGTALLPYNKGRTATHEVGHWLNLFHISGDDAAGSCAGSDLTNDTPNQADLTYGCPMYPATDACSPTAPGIMFMNYMNYVDDNCMNAFTNDQKTRMLAVLNGLRSSLKTSNGCLPLTADFDLNSNLGTQQVTVGNTLTYTVSTTALTGYSGNISLSALNIPANCTAQLNPTSVAVGGSSTLTLTVGAGVTPDFYNLRVSAAGSTTKTMDLTFRVLSSVVPIELLTFSGNVLPENALTES